VRRPDRAIVAPLIAARSKDPAIAKARRRVDPTTIGDSRTE